VRPVVEHGVRTGGVLSFKPLYARSPAEEALRLGEELYRSLARNLHQSSVLLFDHDLRVLVAEGESLATGDIPYEAMSRRRLRDVLSPATWALLRQPARAALRGERLTFDLPSDDGEQLYKVTVGPIRDDQGAVQAGLLVAEDVTHSRNQAERLTRMAHHDELTGLANRSAFHEAADRALRRATRGDTRSALLFVDLDGLKSINDRLGHEAGDELLRSTALRLKGAVREIDTVARLGGDEFAVLLESVRSDREVAAAAERLVRAVAEPLRIGGLHEAHATASIGIAIQGSIDDSGAELLRQADAAMYRAKGLGGNRYHFFDAASDMRVSMRREAGMALAQALERREFELHYQPEISLDTGAVVAVEALVRWHHPQRGLLHPGEFLAEAERRGIMDAIDEWVVGEACVQGMIWSQEGLPPFRIAVNLSTAALRRSDFEDIVAHHLDRAGLSASRLEFELPEKILAEDDDLATEQALRRLRTRGSRIVIDRFGTGRSPLGRLRTFPVDAIKMDRTFTQELGAERAMAGGLIDLAHRLRLEVIAGAVETQDQLQILRENGCDRAVGHAITAPAPAGALTTWLLEREATRSRPAGPPHRDDPGPGGGGGRRFARRRR
jgi:diguanylate cyclase (GGDEF)-like protein